MNHLRKRGLSLIIYLDDILLIASSRQECLDNIKDSVELLESLGLIINYKKSRLVLCQRIEFLGIMFDSTLLELQEDKKRKIFFLLEKFTRENTFSIRQWSSFIGSINFFIAQRLNMVVYIPKSSNALGI